MSEILQLNVLVMYLLYGLSFYTMGMAIALQYRSYSSFRLAYSLSLLAAFALLHGLSEWGSVFIPVKVPNFGDLPLWKLIAIQRMLQSVSYFFLFCFGAKLISDTRYKSQNLFWWLTIPTAAFLVWLVQFSRFIPMVGSTGLIQWLLHSECWSRYLLAFPAGVLTAYGLALQITEAGNLNDKSVLRNLSLATVAFGLFAFFSGLVVPHGDMGWLSSILNATTFRNFTGLPIELFRTGTALLATYAITRLLVIFDLEKQKQVAETRRLEAILRERERFARDLHDDVIQSIYAVGLELQTTKNNIEKDPVKAAEQVVDAVGRLNNVIHVIRQYIQGLEAKTAEQDLKTSLNSVIAPFRKKGLKIKFNFQLSSGIRVKPVVEAEDWEQQLRQILREALNNVVRHSLATKAQIDVRLEGDNLVMTVKDNGRGIPKELPYPNEANRRHMGVKNMRRRTSLLGGEFQLESEPGEGTKIEVSIPLQ